MQIAHGNREGIKISAPAQLQVNGMPLLVRGRVIMSRNLMNRECPSGTELQNVPHGALAGEVVDHELTQ